MSTSPGNTPVLGIDIDNVSSTQLFRLGTKVEDRDGNVFMYVKATGTRSRYKAYIIDNSYNLGSAIDQTTDDAAPLMLGVPQMAGGMANGDYGWVFVGPGNFTVNCLASCTQDVPLYTTATGGSLHSTSTSAKMVQGAKLITTIGGAAADSACIACTKLYIAS